MFNRSPCFFTARDDGQYVVSYELTNMCNMNCMHCMNKSGKYEFSGMEFGQINELLREMSDAGIQYIYISGGEPLLYPWFDQMVACAYGYGFQIILATNGLEVPKHIDTIKKYISDVSISLDGLEEVHDEFRGTPGAFAGVVSAVNALRENGVYTRFSTVLWKKSILQLDELIAFAEAEGIRKINFSILVPTGRTMENDIQIPWEAYPKLLDEIDRLRTCYGDMELVLRRSKVIGQDSIDCIGGDPIMHIDAHGRISPCSWCSKADKSDLFSMKWEKGKFMECMEKCKNLKKVIEDRKKVYGYSGCPAIALFQNGDFMAPDPLNTMLGRSEEE